jgi:Spy/CpxP family protein refolding chaperone
MIKRCALAILFAAAGMGAFGAAAYARHGGPPGAGRMAMMPFEAVLRPDQKQLLYTMVKADRAKLESLHRRLHAAREALIEKLLAQDPSVDVSNQVAELKAAQAAMIDERVAIALAARKLLSPRQLKDAAQFHAKLEELHRQESALLQQMEGSKGGPGSGQGEPGDEGAIPSTGGK